MRQIAWGVLAAALMTSTAAAQAPTRIPNLRQQIQSATLAMTEQAAAPSAPAPKFTVSGALDFPTLYLFRGIRQEENPDLTFQPAANLAYAATDKVTLNVGTWNSIHSGSIKDNVGAYYETDFIASAAFATGSKVNPTVQYTAYTSPVDGFLTVHELAFIAAVDDSKSKFVTAPVFTLAFELGDHGADAGEKKGIYLEAGISPAIPLKDVPVSLSVPVKFGFSLKDYYENPVTGEDSKFGYFSIGVMATGKLSPNLDLHGGFLVYAFGDTLKEFNLGDSSEVVGTVGLGFSFKK